MVAFAAPQEEGAAEEEGNGEAEGKRKRWAEREKEIDYRLSALSRGEKIWRQEWNENGINHDNYHYARDSAGQYCRRAD